MSIEVRNLSKRFGQFRALNDVSLHIETGELVALLGPSGCGKTTLLRVIAGLESADSGSVLFAGEDATGVDVRQRQVGFVFQHYALFKHMTVFENVAFGLRVKHRSQRPSEDVIQRKVHDLLGLVQLDWLADRYPAQLSGGQRQRIALARALAVEPRVLLLDEPFGALDEVTRADMQQLLLQIISRQRTAALLITHDIDEALLLSDRVLLLGHSPARTLGQWSIDLPAPRAERIEELGALRIEILKTLRRASRNPSTSPLPAPSEIDHVPGRLHSHSA